MRGWGVESSRRAALARLDARPRERLSAWLIQDDDGKPLGTFGLRSRFDQARTLAGVDFQFRDIRAKAVERYRRPGALAETVGPSQPRNDRAPRASADWGARKPAPLDRVDVGAH